MMPSTDRSVWGRSLRSRRCRAWRRWRPARLRRSKRQIPRADSRPAAARRRYRL